MNHLNDEQFEDILQGRVSPPAHLDQCPQCQTHLAEKRTLARKLHLAFNSVQPRADLADRIRSQIKSAANSSEPERLAQHTRRPHIKWRTWSPLAVAAAILVVAVPLGLYLTSSSQAQAAQAELVKIHRHNLEPHQEFYTDDNPEKLAEYFKSKLGFTPALPCTDQGLAIRGCCVAHFRDRIVGSYVVDTPKGVLSVIVVTDTPQSIGMTRLPQNEASDQVFWSSSFARCNMITVRIDDYSYCAVGEVSHNMLSDLLSRLLR